MKENIPHEATRAPKPEKETPPFSISSIDLDNALPHKIEDPARGIEGFFLNTKHVQDAFAVCGNAVVVCDGVSAFPQSGLYSAALAHDLAKEIEISGIHSAVSEGLLRETAQRTEKHLESSAVKDKSFSTTFVAAQINKLPKTISYASLGDSPLFVVDRNEDGSVSEFEIVNFEWPIDNQTYAKKANIQYLQNPYTHAVGVSDDGEFRSHLIHMVSGEIEYRPRRSVVLASDFLTKLLLLSPEGTEALLPVLDSNHRFDLEVVQPVYSKFGQLWLQNPATKKRTLNPLFFVGMGKGEWAVLMERWKNVSYFGKDDATMIAIDMDKAFTAQTPTT